MADDERLGHATREEGRPKRVSATEVRGLTREQRRAAYASELYSNVMPTLPKLPGYHVCWCSTTSQSDTIQRREALGYERIKPEELPGFDHVTVTSGPFAGCIGLNEMLAMKLPLDSYWDFMGIAHNERPMQHEEKMRSTLNSIRHNGDGVRVELADGSQSFMKGSLERRPMFTE